MARCTALMAISQLEVVESQMYAMRMILILVQELRICYKELTERLDSTIRKRGMAVSSGNSKRMVTANATTDNTKADIDNNTCQSTAATING